MHTAFYASKPPRMNSSSLNRRRFVQSTGALGAVLALSKPPAVLPAESPGNRIIVGVMLDEPSAGKYYGGEVAAPVFSETVQQTLRVMGVQPDISIRPQIVANTVQESF